MKQTYIRDQAHGFHLLREVERVLQPSAFHGPQNERVKGVPVRLDTVERHVVVDVPQEKRKPSLRIDVVNDAVVLRHIAGVVSLPVFLRLSRSRRRQVSPAEESKKW